MQGLKVRGDGRWPNVDAWFNEMETRPTYLGIKSDAFTHVFDLPPQIGGCEFTAEGEAVAGRLDGSARGAWRLPLPPLTATSLECHSPGACPPGRKCPQLFDDNIRLVLFQ